MLSKWLVHQAQMHTVHTRIHSDEIRNRITTTATISVAVATASGTGSSCSVYGSVRKGWGCGRDRRHRYSTIRQYLYMYWNTFPIFVLAKNPDNHFHVIQNCNFIDPCLCCAPKVNDHQIILQYRNKYMNSTHVLSIVWKLELATN